MGLACCFARPSETLHRYARHVASASFANQYNHLVCAQPDRNTPCRLNPCCSPPCSASPCPFGRTRTCSGRRCRRFERHPPSHQRRPSRFAGQTGRPKKRRANLGANPCRAGQSAASLERRQPAAARAWQKLQTLQNELGRLKTEVAGTKAQVARLLSGHYKNRQAQRCDAVSEKRRAPAKKSAICNTPATSIKPTSV